MKAARIVRITWRIDIPPTETKQLVFVAQNPQGPTRGIRWKVRQLFAEGDRADWFELPPGEARALDAASGVAGRGGTFGN